MFTVIICDEHIINDCHGKYYIYLKPFLDNTDIAFCKWNVSGGTLDDALPELRGIIGNKSEWRAVIVNDNSTWDFESVNKRNPFNYTDSVNEVGALDSRERIRKFRENEERLTEKALSNPLTKLSAWLCGLPSETAPDVCYAGYEDVIENISDEKAYFKKAEELGASAREIELDRKRLGRFEKLSRAFGGAELFNPPRNVLALAERTKDVRREIANSAWKKHMEFDYSQFRGENLYSEKLRFLICDVPYLKGKPAETQYFNFLTAILLLAANESPSGVLRANRAYSLNIEIDSDCVRELCNRYNAKLKATLREINNKSMRLKEEQSRPIDRDTAEFYFETGVTVPVNIDRFFEEDNLKARYDQIGLAEDCPNDEYIYWSEQYSAIEKLFVKYLREPRRAVKAAARDKFPVMNKNEDERAERLSEFQKENVRDFIDEEEQNMVTLKTTHLYNTAKYKEKMEKADKELKDEIGRRMTKKKTIAVGLIAAAAYFFGFIPLLIGNLNTAGSFLFSLGMAGITLGVFLAAGFAALLFARRDLIDRFKNFNDVMDGILSEIRESLGRFSEYLSSACNVMRGFSVLETTKNSYEKKQNILKNHERIILEKIKEVNELFAGCTDDDSALVSESAVPYDFDFTQMKRYQYEMPYSDAKKSVVFMQEGNEISVPVDYLKSVIAEREELYD